jgi:hypothetical protein
VFILIKRAVTQQVKKAMMGLPYNHEDMGWIPNQELTILRYGSRDSSAV